MLCEKYKPALIEAAITGADLPPVVRAHADSCANCATELTQQRSLVAAIDANLHRQMNAPIPAATLHRLGAHLAQQPQPSSTPRFAQIFAGTLTTLAVAALVLVFFSHWKMETLEPNAKVNVKPTDNSNASQIQVHIGPSSQSTTPPGTRTQAPTERHTRTRVVIASTTASRQEPEVIVPPDERIAMEHFIADLRGRGEIALALAKRVTEQREQPIVPVDAPDIQIASLKVPPIRDTDMSSDK
jgi:hypothetical protein